MPIPQASVLTESDVRWVFRFIETTRHGDRNRLAFVLSIYGGMRAAPTAIAATCEMIDKRKARGMTTSLKANNKPITAVICVQRNGGLIAEQSRPISDHHSPFWIAGEYIVLRRNPCVACVATLCPALRKLGRL